MNIMKTLTIDGVTYEIVDEQARNTLRRISYKYVEDYREEGMTDDQVISAAIRDLNDYETLVFGTTPGHTYKLENPVILTQSIDPATGDTTYRNRRGVTFLGRGCTITNGVTDKSLYPWLANTSSALFIMSDIEGNGLLECTITGFTFKGSITSVALKDRFSGIRCTTSKGSTYINHCKIDHCTFKNLCSAIYTCGGDNEYSHNKIDTCYVGISDDGSTRANYHDNYFYTTQSKGLLAQQSYDTTIEHNIFYKCRGDAIALSGTQPRERSDETPVRCVVSNNIIRGSGHFLEEDKKTVENGIVSYGYKDLIISNNIIRSVATNTSDTDYIYGHGIIIGGGYNSKTSCRVSSRVIVEGNEIYNPARNGIRIRYASCVQIINNSIYGYGGDAFGGENKQFVAISNSLATDVSIKGNLIQNYKYLLDNEIVDASISTTESNRVVVSDNTIIEGMTWADTRRYKEDPSILEVLSTANMNVILREGITYSIWIPAINSDPAVEDSEGNLINYYSAILYKKITYQLKDNAGDIKKIEGSTDYGYFQEILYRIDEEGRGYFEVK